MNEATPTPPAPTVKVSWRSNLTFAVVMSPIVYAACHVIARVMERGITQNTHRGPYATVTYEVGAWAAASAMQLTFAFATLSIVVLMVARWWACPNQRGVLPQLQEPSGRGATQN